MATIRIQVRRGLASQWTSVNPTLEAGEIGLETDTNKIKFGTGSTAWTALSYLSVGDIPEIAMDAINTALSLGSGLTKSYNDATDTISISLDTAVVATLSGTQTLTNKTLTSPVINTPTGITKSDVGLANVDNTTDANKPVSTAAQTALDLKAPLASPTFTGTVTTGHILPATDVSSDLGSPAKMWRDIYVGPGSLYVNGQKVLQTDAGDVVITADANENLALRTSGSGNIELDPTGAGTVSIKGPMVIEAAANITSADGNGINFGSTINADAISSKTLNTDLSLSGNGTGKVYLNDNAEVNGNLVVGGNLTVSGTTTTVNTETISLADNIIDLNSNFTTGTPTENAGIKIKRGDSSDVQMRWNESSDKWEFTNDGANYSVITPTDSPTFTGTVAGITKTMVGLGSVDNTTDAAKPVSTATQTALDLKAPLASPTFTGTVAGVTKAHVGLGDVDNTSDASKPISTATQTALDLKATNAALASHEADTTTIHGIANTALLATMNYVDTAVGALSSSVDTDFIPVGDRGGISGVAPLNASVKIDNVYLTSDVVLKDETQTLTNKSLTSPALTGVPIAPTADAGTNTTQIATTAYTVAAINALIDGAPGTLNTLNELAAAVNDDASYAAAIASELTAKAPLASPSFSGTVSLPPTTSIGSVNGTTIAYLDGVTSAIQTQMNAKAPLDSPTFTGTVVGIGKSMVGLANVDNTTDANKPVSTAAQTALDLKAPLASPTFTGVVTIPSGASISGFAPLAAPTFTGAVSLPTTTVLGVSNLQGALDLKAPLASPTFTGVVVLPDSTVSTAMIADSAITSGKIADGAIVNADINGAAAISTSKIDGLDNTLSSKAPTASPVFTGTVVLPATTSIGDVSAEELQSISTVVSNVQTQISSKADAVNASISGATFTGTVVLPSTTSIADVSATEISYLNNVTGSIQTQLNSLGTADSTHAALTLNVHGIANTALLATTADVAAVTKTTLGLGNVDNTADTAKPVSTAQTTAIATAKAEAIADATSQVNALLTGAPAALNTLDELAAALGDDANFASSVTTSLGLKVDSLTPISQKTASYTLSSLTERDDLIEMSSASALVLTIPTDATLNFPIGTSIDILQTGAGQVTVAPVSGTVTVNATPGLKLRTTWSSATLFKRAANTWVVFGDLTA